MVCPVRERSSQPLAAVTQPMAPAAPIEEEIRLVGDLTVGQVFFIIFV